MLAKSFSPIVLAWSSNYLSRVVRKSQRIDGQGSDVSLVFVGLQRETVDDSAEFFFIVVDTVVVRAEMFTNYLLMHVILLVTWYMNSVEPPDTLSRGHVMVFPCAGLDSLVVILVLGLLLVLLSYLRNVSFLPRHI